MSIDNQKFTYLYIHIRIILYSTIQKRQEQMDELSTIIYLLLSKQEQTVSRQSVEFRMVYQLTHNNTLYTRGQNVGSSA